MQMLIKFQKKRKENLQIRPVVNQNENIIINIPTSNVAKK